MRTFYRDVVTAGIGAGLALALSPAVARPSAPDPVNGVVRARQLEILDADGRVRLWLHTGEQGTPIVQFLDSSGHTTMLMDGAGKDLDEPHGHLLVGLTGLVVYGGDRNESALLDKDGVFFFDPDARVRRAFTSDKRMRLQDIGGPPRVDGTKPEPEIDR